MSELAIDIRQLGFRYPGQKANSLTNITLNVKKGERFGLFGPNGAGKTTLMNCMTGILGSFEGDLLLMGETIHQGAKKIKQQIGYVPQDFAFYEELKPSENFDYFGAMYNLNPGQIKQKSAELISVLEIDDTKELRRLSGGMKRRVNLAIGVLHEPNILFLDEPTVGVDVFSRRAIIHYLKSLNDLGTTLIYTSHQLSEAEELCETIAMIHQGKIIAHDTLSSLLEKHKENGLEGLFVSLTGKNFLESDE